MCTQDVVSQNSDEMSNECLISQILPEINWRPVTSKFSKESYNNLELNFPLTYKAMEYMLSNDFELPRLNTSSRRSNFRFPSDAEKCSLLEVCPTFKSGRYNVEEQSNIMKNLKTFFKNVKFSLDEQRSFIQELKRLPACHGGNRGATSHNLSYARLYFACHVAGPGFLKYRLAWDLYKLILSLWNKEFDQMLKPGENKKEKDVTKEKSGEEDYN